jgi:hypothetical protein
MQYEVTKYNGQIDFQNLVTGNIVVQTNGENIPINGKNSICRKVEIEESISIFDFLLSKKLKEDDIYEIALSTVNKLMPKASEKEKNEAKELYLKDNMKFKSKSFVLQLDKFALIICKKGTTDSIINYLGIKQNLTTNLLMNLGIPQNDFLLWICWVTDNSTKFKDIEIRNISEDRTVDKSQRVRSQKESGGQNVLDSLDFKYRIGSGYPINGLKFEIEETNLGAYVDIGLFIEDMNKPFITVSRLTILKRGTLNPQIISAPNVDKELLKINIAIALIYKLANEYTQDKKWPTQKQNYVNSLIQEAAKHFKGNKMAGQNP